MPERVVLRSYLFAPGLDEHKLNKAVVSGSDAVVFDLEDSVAPDYKEQARDLVGRVVRELDEHSGTEIHIRVNRIDGAFDPADIGVAVVPPVTGIRLPKVVTVSDVQEADRMIAALEDERGIPKGSVRLYPTIESAAGVLASADIARSSHRIAAFVFGPADFAASIGVHNPPFEATFLARSTIVLASAAAGLAPPIDGAYLNVGDLEGLREHTLRVRSLGFLGKSAIHPRQISVLHEVFTPSDEEVSRARRVVQAVNERESTGMVGGAYVDPAVIAQAQAVLDLAERTESEVRP